MSRRPAWPDAASGTESGSTPLFLSPVATGDELNEKGSCRMNRELVTGLAQLSAEKGLPKEVVSDIIARAIKRAYGAEENIDVKVDVQTGAFKVFLLKTVVDKVEDPKLQIQIDAALRMMPDVAL